MPNPGSDIDPAIHHWFLGAGMVHGVRLRDGRAEWYRNRRVVGDDGSSPNTNVGGFAGTTWAMVEAGSPPVELCILDGQDITGPEVARIHLPQRVPFGFHGNWVSDTSVAPPT